MQAVLISIHPKWCELIASGKKTVEVRKTKPKLETPFKVYIYCTQDKRLLRKFSKGERIDDEHFFDEHVFVRQNTWIRGHFNPNGKVIGEFVCKKIYDITPHFDTPTFPNQYICGWNYGKEFDCLSFEELTSYLNGKQGYGWHISDLVIYDKPKELSEFKLFADRSKGQRYHEDLLYLQRPPQSWCYVEEVSDE